MPETIPTVANALATPVVAELQEKNIFEMVTGSGPVVQAVLIILIFLSVWSWAITIAKVMYFRRAKAQTKEFARIFWDSRNFTRADDAVGRLQASPLTRLFSVGYRELSRIIQQGAGRTYEPLSVVEGALYRSQVEEVTQLEKGITFLASVASSAPFIGLFGTVWGIMNAFHGLAQAKSSTIQAVAPGISEALVATAIGLAAAIPAAVAYNYFVVAVKHFKQHMTAFSNEFLSLAKQQISAE